MRISSNACSIAEASSAVRFDQESADHLYAFQLYDVLGLDGGRGKTMRDLVDRDRKLPVNLAILNKAKLHTDTYGYKHAHVHKSTQQN